MKGVPLPFFRACVHQTLTHPNPWIKQSMPMAYTHKSVLHLPWVDSLSVFLSELLLVTQYCWSRLSKDECSVVRISYNKVTVQSHDRGTLTKRTTHKYMFDLSERPTIDVTPLLCLVWSYQLQSRHNKDTLTEKIRIRSMHLDSRVVLHSTLERCVAFTGNYWYCELSLMLGSK